MMKIMHCYLEKWKWHKFDHERKDNSYYRGGRLFAWGRNYVMKHIPLISNIKKFNVLKENTKLHLLKNENDTISTGEENIINITGASFYLLEAEIMSWNMWP